MARLHPEVWNEPYRVTLGARWGSWCYRFQVVSDSLVYLEGEWDLNDLRGVADAMEDEEE